jgi:hypothetical protein
MLVDHANAHFNGVQGRAEFDLLAVNENLAFVGLILTKEDFHQGGFTGTVFTQNSVNLANLDLKIYLVVGDNAWEPLGDPPRFQDRVTT